MIHKWDIKIVHVSSVIMAEKEKKTVMMSVSFGLHCIITVSFSASQYQYPPQDGSFTLCPFFINSNASLKFISLSFLNLDIKRLGVRRSPEFIHK